ncbi:MAG: nucleotidyltransferase domain-containing protein [Nanoarchaeota archaeon]|nr:nucleotidyltransferase domain-containing protein [Nanoarchaeota archaeon]
MNKELTKKLNSLVKKISQLPNVSAIFLFGSNVSGKTRRDSDIDVAVLTKNSNEEEEFEIIGCGNKVFDISVFARLPLIIRFRILKEGKLLFCRDKKYLLETNLNTLKNYLDFSVFINRFYKRAIKNV